MMLTVLPNIFCSCGGDEDPILPGKEEEDKEETPIVIQPVTDLEAVETKKANELKVSWKNSEDRNVVIVELAYTLLTEGTKNEIYYQQVKVSPGSKSATQIRVPVYGEYEISAVAIDNYGRRSDAVTVNATPAEKDFEINWSEMADSCTYVLIEQFMNKDKGTFWKSPHDMAGGSFNIYWQQAHAIDVVLYSYQRIKDSNPELADTYRKYFELWYANKANNYHHDSKDETGFSNPFTDDMCWICLTLIRMTEATGDDTYINTAKKVYDQYIIPRAWTDENGTGLPWKNETGDNSRRNGCTNTPGCLVAAKLYRKFNDEKYLNDAQTLYRFVVDNLLKDDGRVEEPPLTYTQGTFGEACRQLFHITSDESYMRMAEKVIYYTATSDRCLKNGILRHEGESADQSIFKAVFIPYAVNLTLDEHAKSSVRNSLKNFLIKNANALHQHLDRKKYPAMYCNYYWGETFYGDIASMGAQTSGASLMEGVARMIEYEKNEESKTE